MNYIVKRTYTVYETLIVKADTPREAFINAGLNYHSVIRETHTGHYEPEFNSITPIAYVAEDTEKELE